jgi:hypothetical protein
MKRVEVKLSLPAVAPLLDLVKAVVDGLGGRLAAPNRLQDLDADLRASWHADRLQGQTEDCRRFLALFDREFFASGTISLDEDNAESVLRACAAIRLRLREEALKELRDEEIENADPEVNQLGEAVQKAFLGYVFLATLQELIIQHLDSAILDG